MESLRANRMLMFAIGASGTIVLFLTSGAMPGLSQFFEIVDFPPSVSILYRLIQNSNIKFFILFEITVPRYVAHCADARYCWRLFTGSHLFIPIWGNASQVQSPQLLKLALTSNGNNVNNNLKMNSERIIPGPLSLEYILNIIICMIFRKFISSSI